MVLCDGVVVAIIEFRLILGVKKEIKGVIIYMRPGCFSSSSSILSGSGALKRAIF